jgi:hypothetical protein
MLLRDSPDMLSRMAPASCFFTLSVPSPPVGAQSIFSAESRSSGSSFAIMCRRFRVSSEYMKRLVDAAAVSCFTPLDASGSHLSAAADHQGAMAQHPCNQFTLLT